MQRYFSYKCHYIAEISLNVTLNHNQQQQQRDGSDVQADYEGVVPTVELPTQ